jgi:hypothetical protein
MERGRERGWEGGRKGRGKGKRAEWWERERERKENPLSTS